MYCLKYSPACLQQSVKIDENSLSDNSFIFATFTSFNISSMVLGYRPKGDIQEDVLLYGYLHSSLIYEASKKEDTNKGEEGK